MSDVDEIKSRLDIVAFISRYVPSLKKAGRTYKGLCPFHQEKTPSFVVYPENQSWRCFGACATGGDVFSFLMKQENYDFRQSLQVLAEQTGVTLTSRSPQSAEADKRRLKLLEIADLAAQFFHNQLLQSPTAEYARGYVAQRGLTNETVTRFQVGYAPDRWEALKTHLLERGYAEVDMVAAGLLINRADGSSGYDRFRNRLIVPIRDERGRVIAFGGRALSATEKAKYINSPQGPLFDKSRTIFALDVAKGRIRQAGEVVIVEGYMDALQAHEKGFTNVVAQMGTALTEPQLKLLKRYTQRYILALDADAAGNAATLRGLNVARQALSDGVSPVTTAQGIRYQESFTADLRVARLPVGKDPDDLLREKPELWPEVISQAAPLVDYIFELTAADLDLSTAAGKSTLANTLLPIIGEIKDPVAQTHYLQQLATLVRIDERTLRVELARTNTLLTPQKWPTEPVPDAPVDTKAALSEEEHCLTLVIGRPGSLMEVNQKLFEYELDVLAVADFIKTENKELFLLIKNWAVSGEPTLDLLTNQVPEPLERRFSSLVNLWFGLSQPSLEQVSKDLPKMVVEIRLKHLNQQSRTLSQLQKEAAANGDRTLLMTYLQQMTTITREIQRLDKAKRAMSLTWRNTDNGLN